ncbi:MAG: DUF554 domain-containing protein [Acutalibacteraceae bacterium]|nr:DUF554 domain-containing protein [Acutalibacteraceae bacterium]
MLKIFTSGAFVNFILVVIGGFAGILLKKGIPEKIQQTLMNAMALCVIFIGITGIFEEGINTLIIIVSMALGAVIGQALDLDGAVNRLALKIEDKFKTPDGENGKIAEGFATATLLFCVGAMTVVGSIDSGISGDNTTLYSKSVIDCISAMVFASTMGIGVVLSSVAVLVIEGALTILASVVEPILTTAVVAHMSVIGSLLIIAIALNMLKVTKIKVMNIIPAIFLPILFCLFI